MAIKVLAGLDEKYVKRVSCPMCASRLEYVAKDLTARSWVNEGGLGGFKWALVCPVCVRDIDVEYDDEAQT